MAALVTERFASTHHVKVTNTFIYLCLFFFLFLNKLNSTLMFTFVEGDTRRFYKMPPQITFVIIHGK